MASPKSNSEVDLTLDKNFYVGRNKFQFPNGDIYEGDYIAHRSGLVWREGTGTYTTKEGQIYSGKWINDKLDENEQLEITYPDGAQYNGTMVDNKYCGGGIYALEANLKLVSEFSENKPTGEVVLFDPDGKVWQGKANENESLLLPEHIYFNTIGEEFGKGKPRAKPASTKSDIVSAKQEDALKSDEKVINKDLMKKLEIKVFAKTKKTLSDLRFEDSSWYQNYINFNKIYTDITTKLKDEGEDSLSEDESKWYKNYLEFKSRYLKILEGRQKNEKDLIEHNLYELYNSEEFKNSCLPISVIYPNPISIENDDTVDISGDGIEKLQ